MRILLILDDSMMTDGVPVHINLEGMDVICAQTGDKGLELARAESFDIMIIDDLLPNMTGMDVLKQMRQEEIDTPVIVLNSEDDGAERAKFFNAGADQVIQKPFHQDEFIATINAIMRRVGRAPQIISIDKDAKLKVNQHTQKVTYEGRYIDLTDKEYKIFELLALNKGRIVSKDVLNERLYKQGEVPKSKVIDVFINGIRNKLGRATGGKNYIKTVWRRGFVLEDEPVIPEAKKSFNAKASTMFGKRLRHVLGIGTKKPDGTEILDCDVFDAVEELVEKHRGNLPKSAVDEASEEEKVRELKLVTAIAAIPGVECGDTKDGVLSLVTALAELDKAQPEQRLDAITHQRRPEPGSSGPPRG